MRSEYEIIDIKKNKDKYSVFIDSLKLNISEDIIIKYNLFVGKKMTESEYIALVDGIDYNNLLNKTIKYIAYQPRSKKEIEIYLKKSNVNQSNKDKVLNKLIEYKYLNDDDLAKSIFEYEKNVKKKGPKVIEQKLLIKGISKLRVSELVGLYDEDSQIENINFIIEKEIQKNKKFPVRKRKKTITDKLIRDGFDHELVYEKISNLELEDDSYQQLLIEVVKLKRRYIKDDEFQAKQKIINNLINKGFEYSAISKALNDSEFQD